PPRLKKSDAESPTARSQGTLGHRVSAITDHNTSRHRWLRDQSRSRLRTSGRWPMPIRPFLNREQFDQETIRILGVAFEQVCITLRTGDRDDNVSQAIANKIIELAKTGERNPDLLDERALELFANGKCYDAQRPPGA